MKILIVRGGSGEKNNDTGYYLSRVCEEMGFSCRLVEHDSIISQQPFLFYKQGLNYVAKKKLGRKKDVFQLTSKADRNVLDQARDFQPDLIIVFKGMYLRREVVEELRKVANPKYIVNYYSDNILLTPVALRAAAAYDAVYLHDSYVLDKFRRLGLARGERLWHSFYPPEHRPMTEFSDADRKAYSADLSLIGSTYPYRATLLESLRGLDLKVWGNFWGFGSHEELAQTYMYQSHQHATIDQDPKVMVFNLTKINLNTMQPIECVHGSNSRVHQLSGCKAFQLHEYNPDLEPQYAIGEEVITFKTAGELRELAEHYLKHPEERQAIAAKAYQRALKEHTVHHRLEALLDDLNMS